MNLDKLANVEEVSILATWSEAVRVVEHDTGWKNGSSKNFGVAAGQTDWLCLSYGVRNIKSP